MLTQNAAFPKPNKAFIGKASSEASCLTDAQTKFARDFCYVIAKIMLFLLQVGVKSLIFFVYLSVFSFVITAVLQQRIAHNQIITIYDLYSSLFILYHCANQLV